MTVVKKDLLKLYDEYFVARDFERLDLFQLLADKYGIQRALYPGSFVHITPSFVYPITSYVDSDKRAKKFFNDAALQEFVAERKRYSQPAQFSFHAMDYQQAIDEKEESFDLLISQYAGFVSQPCKRYLRVGGLLLANNSHGDASMAFLDEDYGLTAVILGRNGHYRLSKSNLDKYFVPKSSRPITKAYLEESQRGVGYKKSASMYLFERVK
jgi:hypothetical protein